jgi:uncharacterized protein YjbK
LELKVRTLDNHEEICEPISLEEFNLVLQGQLPAGAIQTRLRELNMLWPLLWISTTNSVRKKIHFYGGVLVLDQTRCCLNLQTHYQLEFRSKQANSPQAIELIKKQLQVVAHGHRRKREEIWPGPVV